MKWRNGPSWFLLRSYGISLPNQIMAVPMLHMSLFYLDIRHGPSVYQYGKIALYVVRFLAPVIIASF